MNGALLYKGTHGAAGDAVEALLALDGHVGAVGCLELDIEGRCSDELALRQVWKHVKLDGALLTLAGVVEVFVDELSRCQHICLWRINLHRCSRRCRTSLALLPMSPNAGMGSETALTFSAAFSVKLMVSVVDLEKSGKCSRRFQELSEGAVRAEDVCC